MTDDVEHIPFQVDVGRILEVLARQIYQSPLALLRENTQNAFDAILLRRAVDKTVAPLIEVQIAPDRIQISDNGIGMTSDDLRNHFWRAGSSSKNTPEARRAGVVGTFGIGAMANFGVASALTVTTESFVTGERTESSALKATLSTSKETISLRRLRGSGTPGTIVVADITDQLIDVQEASTYLEDFVRFVPLPVWVNGGLVSQADLGSAVPRPRAGVVSRRNVQLTGAFAASVEVAVLAGTGELWVHATRVRHHGAAQPGDVYLRQGAHSIKTFRSGFGLATIAVSSQYQLGGVANLPFLQPTAGRESLTTDSLQALQELVAGLERYCSPLIAEKPEADLNTAFQEWIRQNGEYELAANLKMRIEPGDERLSLGKIRELSQTVPILVYAGSDRSIIDAVATDDRQLAVLAVSNPRRQCEREFLSRYCQTEEVKDAPTVLSLREPATLSLAEQAICFRVTSILQADYFLRADISVGRLSHGLPIVVDASAVPPRIVLDTDAPSLRVLIQLYESEFEAFGGMVKDLVRNIVFPKVADLVPSSTRQGAEAFLKTIRRTRDVFEYEFDDLESLSAIWERYLEGSVTLAEAASRATVAVQRNVQYLDQSSERRVTDVIPDVVENEAALQLDPASGPAPSIMRTEIGSDAKLLTVPDGQPALKGYRVFIALSDRAHDERGEFFLQPHATSIVWGGQKVLFVFEHHSGQFGLYYDLMTPQVVSGTSGGGPFPTATMVLKNRIYIPVPTDIALAFVPVRDERKRFEVRCDLLFTDRSTLARA